MPAFNKPPKYLSQQESRRLASRQLLTFLFLPEEHDPKTHGDPLDDLFSVERLPESAFTNDPNLFAFKSRKIFDVDGLELFHDHSLEIDSENEITVRVAASELLGTPVWSVSAGPKDTEPMARETMAFIKRNPDLELILVEGESVPIVCYDYPKLGIICRYRDKKEKVVVDLSDQTIIPMDRSEEAEYPSLKTVWSPYDRVTRSRIGYRRWLWQRKTAALPEWKASRENLRHEIRMAMASSVVKYTDEKLEPVGQQTDYYCAPATVHMILKFYGKNKTQDEIADAMETSAEQGSTLPNQETSIAEMFPEELVGDVDDSEDFAKAQAEIDANRPFKSGTVTDHARACGGYKVLPGSNWLIIYDPWPPDGSKKTEEWDAGDHKNFMYVRRLVPA